MEVLMQIVRWSWVFTLHTPKQRSNQVTISLALVMISFLVRFPPHWILNIYAFQLFGQLSLA